MIYLNVCADSVLNFSVLLVWREVLEPVSHRLDSSL